MVISDSYRYDSIKGILNEQISDHNAIELILSEGNESGIYHEILPIDDIKKESHYVSEYIDNFIYNRLDKILYENDLELDYDNLILENSNLYDGYDLNVPIRKVYPHKALETLFNEVDNEVNQPSGNNTLQSPINKEPDNENVYPPKKTQNPRKVDLILKSVFEDKFEDYNLQTDIGQWHPTKKHNNEGKLMLRWEHKKESGVYIDTLLFPSDTNKIMIQVKERNGTVLIDHFLEIYRIPTDSFISEKFFRKTFFNLLKKFIETKVVQIPPFSNGYVFWKTDNPTFSYSFSVPNKNKIIIDLISFVNTAKSPILDDFFEQNNLKHKQGYLQTLLDSAEAAGIFRFKRDGNEILIIKGPNYKSFLEGKLRRVLF